MNRYTVVVKELYEYRISTEAESERAAEDELWAAFEDGATPEDFTTVHDAQIESVRARKPYAHEVPS